MPREYVIIEMGTIVCDVYVFLYVPTVLYGAVYYSTICLMYSACILRVTV